MNRLRAIMAILMLALAHRLAAGTNEIRTQQKAILLQEQLRQKLLADITPIVSHIRDGVISQAESRRLSDLLELLTRNDLRGKTAVERQQVIIKLLGKTDYENIRSYYMKECQSASSRSAQQLGADMLGHRLFSIESRNVLMPLLMSEDRQTQFFATISLACLGEKGAYSLLHYIVMSQLFGDLESSYALDALGVANDPDAGRLAVQLCLATNFGPMVVSASLPLMKREPEYYQIVSDMIKGNRFSPPKRKQEMTGEELYQERVVMNLLGVIDSNVELLAKDDILFKIIQEYAESNEINDLVSDRALLILKHGGVGRKYFEGLLTKKGVPEHKQKCLRQILVLIEQESIKGSDEGVGRKP